LWHHWTNQRHSHPDHDNQKTKPGESTIKHVVISF
jgi:hypothetical protein